MTGEPDDENPEWTAEDFKKALPAAALPAEILAAFPNTIAHLNNEDPNEQLMRDIESSDGDDSAARSHLAAGRPIYYGEDDTPPNMVIKEYPDGRRELVRPNLEGPDEVVRELSRSTWKWWEKPSA